MANIRINDLPADAAPNASDVLPVDGTSTRKTTLTQAIDAGRPFASQAEAEAGTSPTKAMSPLSTAQAIAALGGAEFAPTAAGVPVGGTVDQVLGKTGGADYAMSWRNAGAGDMIAAANLSDVDNPATSLANLSGQPLDADLTAISALGTQAYGRSLLTLANSTALSGELSAFYQPVDADLTSWAGVTRAAGFDTFASGPSSSNLKALVSDETGSGALVFATSPTLVTPALGTPTALVLTNATGLTIAGQTADSLDIGNHTVLGAAVSGARVYGRVNDSVSILDYATTVATRTAIKNGSTGFKTVFDLATADAVTRGIKVIEFPDGNFELDNDQILNNPGLHIKGQPGGTYLYKNGDGRMFQTLGTVPSAGFNLTANALAGAVSVTMSLANAANFTVGSHAILRSTASTRAARDAEFVYIIAVNLGTGVITFDAPIYFAYTTANTAQLFVVPPLIEGVGYENLIVDWTDGTATSPQRPPYAVDAAFNAFFCYRPVFRNIACKKMINEQILLHGCIDSYATLIRGKDGYSDSYGSDPANTFAYGIHERGLNMGLIADGMQFERIRHAYTTGVADSTDATQFSGGHPFYSLIANGIHRWAKSAGWDTHEAGIGITFNNLHTFGGRYAGIERRDTDPRIVNCGARDIVLDAVNSLGHGLLLAGGDTSNLWCKDAKVDGFTAYNCGTAGIQNQGMGTTVISGPIHIEKTVEAGINSASSSARNLVINGDVYMNDVAKSPASGSGAAYAVLFGHANQPFAALKNITVDDPNNNLQGVTRRLDTTTVAEFVDVKGRSSTGAKLKTIVDTTSYTGVSVLPASAPLTSSATASNGTTVETDLSSLTVPAATLYRAGTGFRVKAWGDYINNANAKTLKVYLGGVVMLTTAFPVSVGGQWNLEVNVLYNGSGAQKISTALVTTGTAGAALNDVENPSGTLTDTAAIIAKLTGQGGATNDINQRGMIVEFIGA